MNVAKAKAEKVLGEVDSVLKHSHPTKALTYVCTLLRREFGHYNWVGIYLVRGETLHLVGWDGKEATEHTQIPIGKGICGMAARENKTIVIGDVRSSPDYLSCFPYTRSEIVVPITKGKEVLGEIDIDGDSQNAYDDSDRMFLEEVALRICDLTEAVLEGRPWQAV
jgi:GAF domain-containing protein